MSAHGALNEQEQSEANKNHGQREDQPAHVFLEPGERKYPVKVERGGEWNYDRDLLLAAAREARIHGHEALAERADAIRKREFDGAQDAALAFDKSVRTYDEDGRLHISETPISKATVNEYFGAEIPNAERLGLDPQRKYRLLRHPDELKRGAETFNNMPLMIKHIRQSADDPQKDKIVGSLGTDAEFDHPHLKNSMIVWDRDAIEGIENGSRRELSCSYRYEPEMTPGAYNGQPYDGVMRNIRGNHVALVEEGRAGHDCLVEDELPPNLKGRTMKVSRRAMVAQGALAGWLTPMLAADAKLPDLKKVLLGTTAANWQQAKPQIIARATDAMRGRLAKDANLSQMHGFLDSLDHEGKDQMEPDEMEVVDRKARDSENGLNDPEMRERGQEHLGGTDEQRAKDRAARDKAAKGWAADEEPESEEEMRKRHERERGDRAHDAESESQEEMKARHEKEAKDAKMVRDRRAHDRARARDESPEERERKEREEKDRREKERAEDRHARDAAIASAIAANDQKHAEIRDAEAFVRPWIGEIVMAQDSADAVYRLALDTLGVSHKGVHPDALRHILAAQPKPGDRPTVPRLAQDSAAANDFAKRFPNLAAVRHY